MAVATAFLAILLAVAFKTKSSLSVMLSDAMWKLGAVMTPILAWLGNNTATVAALCAIIGVLLNFIFQFREDKRKQKEFEERMTEMREEK